MSDKIVLTRNQLAKFLPTPEAVKAFENLFLQATQLTPSDVNTINANVQVATISADTALGIANYGLSVLQNLSSLNESLEIQPPEVPTIIEDEICITQNININNCDCLEIIKEPDWNFIKNHPTTINGYGITDAYSAVVADAPLAGSGTSGSHLSIPAASAIQNGYLSSTDWSTFNGKQSALTIGNLTETTSSVLTITGGTGAIIGSGLTVQVKQASHTLSGYLSSTDWDTFNGKQSAYTNLTTIGGLANSTGWLYNNGSGTFSYSTPNKSDVGLSNVTNNAQVTSVTGSSPISSSGGTTPAISISQSNTSTNGYLSSTDWNTFNGKQASYTNLTSIGGLADSSGWLKNNGSGTFIYSTPSASDVGLGNVTNNAQVKAITSTANKLVKFSDTSSTITNSVIYDDGTNIGIGTSSPTDGTIHVNSSGATNTNIKFTNSSTGTTSSDGMYVGIGTDGKAYVYQRENDNLIFGTNNQTRVTISSSGNVGIGVSASYQLHLSSDSAAKPSTNTWTISSDERLKENIELANLDRCYEIVKTIPLKRYTWKDSVYTQEQVSDRSKLGWIAQDVQTVFPKAVNVNDFTLQTKHLEINEEGIEQEVNDILEDCLDLNSDQIYAVMYGAIQKLQLKIEELEAKIDKTIQ